MILVHYALCASTVRADTIRGVNLGGWLLVEEWYAARVWTSSQLLYMLTTQDHSFAVPQHER